MNMQISFKIIFSNRWGADQAFQSSLMSNIMSTL
jgi:hypothetical protein